MSVSITFVMKELEISKNMIDKRCISFSHNCWVVYNRYNVALEYKIKIVLYNTRHYLGIR